MLDSQMYEFRAEVIKAMAHPSRLAMIDALSNGELSVCRLQEVVGADISTVSKHLSLLKSSSIVACRKEGLHVYYRLRVPCILNFFGCVDAVIREDIRRRQVASGLSAG